MKRYNANIFKVEENDYAPLEPGWYCYDESHALRGPFETLDEAVGAIGIAGAPKDACPCAL